MNTTIFYLTFLFSIVLISCSKEDNPTICEIEINEDFPPANPNNAFEVFNIDINDDDIDDVEIRSTYASSLYINNYKISVKAVNQLWTLIGKESSYYTCSDSVFSDVDSCLESVTEYTENCDSNYINASKIDINIPISYSEYQANIEDTVEVEDITLHTSYSFNDDVLLNEFKSYHLEIDGYYSFIDDLDMFEILCKDINGELAAIVLRSDENSLSRFYIEKIKLCL